MAPRIIPEYGYDPSCGNYGVSVKQFDDVDGPSIYVQYTEFIGSDHAVHCVELPWSGDELSVAAAEVLLGSAKVPSFIQEISAIGMIIHCVDETLRDIREAAASGQGLELPSILVRISSDRETEEWDHEFEDEDEDEE